jgi:MoaA/NifB/PqqE/SkfB family radical SAM enzyme
MCDIWKANSNGREIAPDELAPHIEKFRKLNVQNIVLSGGEPLMHSNLGTLCGMLDDLEVHLTLLSTGILLERYAEDVVEWSDEVVVSLDGSREIHNEIRRIPGAYEKLGDGVSAVKGENPTVPVTARCVLQRRNYADLPNIIGAARSLGLDQISFLAADVSSTAFNRPDGWNEERVAEVALTRQEVEEFRTILDQVIEDYSEAFSSDFVAEPPDKLRQIPQHYAALNGDEEFPESICNAPWVSAVIEADGKVRPCFFHEELGNIYDDSFDEIVNSEEAVEFRRELDVKTNPTCKKCVCTLYRSPFDDVGA